MRHAYWSGPAPNLKLIQICASAPRRVCTRSRKTLIYLILTLNHCYPDYDFSLLRAHHFRKEPGVAAVEEAVDSHLLEVSKVSLFSP